VTTQTLHLIDEYLTQGGYTHGIDAETLEREAHLIAAAPDLLAALETALEMLTDSWGEEQIAAGDDQVANVIKAAIAKAKGN
jgi:hypothetical protein